LKSVKSLRSIRGRKRNKTGHHRTEPHCVIGEASPGKWEERGIQWEVQASTKLLGTNEIGVRP
jgi:hypothetical protein